MKFRYSARTKQGELQVGFVDAVNKESALNVLTSHGLFILSLEKAKKAPWYTGLFGFLHRVKEKDLAIFTRQFATMLEAKISIHDALKALYYQTENSALRAALVDISNDVDSGLTLSQAMARHDDIFFEFYINLIQSAEVTGGVERAMVYLADYLERQLVILGKVKNALIYPAFIVVLAVIVGGILIGVVFPQIAPLFEESEVDLPIITRIFLVLGNFINNWWIAIIVFFIVFTLILIDYLRSNEGQAIRDQILLTAPILGKFFKKLYVARFAEIASVLIKGGIPIAQAIEIGGHTVGSALYREMLHDVAEGVRRGELMSQSFARYGAYFPPIVNQMITVGEQTGKVDEMFVRIGTFYSREVENVVSNITELIQPVIMVFLGIMVAFLFAAILLPIYNLVQVIR
ncbi:MAG: hypothetical protein COU07_01625 [Candidatus Harrisonbacteria bacterium CG10_big_fil_rev_8_21_14_0_10_40_38]|uniref:Type II secretion system protein GspF domain-containing protein n=1 Tax=Candidatus Harrisonbacteria bacterium CG10_big_fil_rev_8_21_14_0_10_40_38 TaxID=1974583 RepID=A0A2H0UT59_9BACT|nr:MAG: hypothetical protein COU07_01625 [Candidatus Harrisonbacteria bacterium CG10_big_fil_rev_8_21_14_0_10_40_38]